MEHVCRGLNRQAISVPPRGTATEMKQVELWKKYIGWEKENPTETEEYSGYAKRGINLKKMKIIKFLQIWLFGNIYWLNSVLLL